MAREVQSGAVRMKKNVLVSACIALSFACYAVLVVSAFCSFRAVPGNIDTVLEKAAAPGPWSEREVGPRGSLN